MKSEPEQKQVADGPLIDDLSTVDPAVNNDEGGSASDDPWIGKTLGERYLILEVLGKGGMGTVYKARHLTLNTTIAVKILSVISLTDRDKQFRRFGQEAKAASKVRHAHLTSVSDYGLADDESPYLVMDFVQGISLAAEVEAHGRIEPVRAMRIFMQICEAMEAVHNAGIIHRDLKPSNIILEKDVDGKDFARVVDFGIAKLATEAIDVSSKLTQTGEIFGSPLYMSPEQCLGNKLDGRSDIYSLGCLMYETLSGSPPLSGANAVQTIFKHVNDAPSQATLERLNVPAGLVALVLQTLEKKPEHRPQTMEAVRTELQKVTAGRATAKPSVVHKPVVADQDSKRQAHIATGWRWGVSVMIVIGLVGLLALAGFFGYTSMIPASQITSGKGYQQLNLGNTGAARDFFRTAWKQANDSNASDVIKESILSGLGETYRREKNPSQAWLFFEQAKTLARKNNNDLERARLAEILSMCDRDLNNPGLAVREAQEALPIMRRLFTSDSQQTANALDQVAQSEERNKQYIEAEKACNEMLEIDLKLHPDKRFEQIATAYSLKATIAAGLGRSKEAVDAAKMSLDVWQNLEGKDGKNAWFQKDAPLDRFEGDIKRFEQQDKTNPPAANATVFVGSSTFTEWGSELEHQFKDFKAINRGFGGSTIPEAQHYADRIVTKYKPAKIVFYAGTNDIADGHSAQRVSDDFKLFCKKVRAALPVAEIYFVSISVAPSRMQWEQTYDLANKLIEQYIRENPHLHFVDVRPVMRDKKGQLREDLFLFDRLHMKPAGYALWAPIIRQALQATN